MISEIRIKKRLTVGRQVDLAFAGQEVVALPLALEFGRELLRRHLGVGDVPGLLLLHVLIHLFHFDFH